MQVCFAIANPARSEAALVQPPPLPCFKGSVLIQLCNLRGGAAAEDDPGEVEPPPAALSPRG